MMNDSRIAPTDRAAYTLAFDNDGTVAIRADCRRLDGQFTVETSRIEVATGGPAPGACPSGSLSDRFLQDLADAGSFVFRDGRLYLALPADAGILEFAATLPKSEATPVGGD
jgi:heat shock protein HslJ